MAAVPTAAIAAATAVAARARPHRVTAVVDVRPQVTAVAEATRHRAAAVDVRLRAADRRTAVDRRAVAADMAGNDMGGNTALGFPA